MRKQQMMNEEELEKGLEKLFEKIMADNAELDDLVLVGIITRGVAIAERIRKRIRKSRGIELEIGALDTRPYRDDLETSVREDRTHMPFSIDEKTVILVDDVMSTGRTIRAAMDALLKSGRPKVIKTAVLIDRKHRELPINADYVGIEVLTSVKEKIQVKLREVDGGKDRALVTGE